MLVDNITLALLTGMSVRTVSAKVVANLGWDKVKATPGLRRRHSLRGIDGLSSVNQRAAPRKGS